MNSIDDDYDAAADFAASIEECYRAIRERMARGGPPWVPPDPLPCDAAQPMHGKPADGQT